MKKVLVLSLCVVLALLVLSTSAFATTYDFDSFTDGAGYGKVEKVDDNVTKITGGPSEGPFSKASTQKLEDGISEKVNVEINLDKMAQGELFEVSLALKNSADAYVTEAVVMAQKVDANTVKLTAGWAPDFSINVTESGIYTFNWEMYTENGKSYVNFSLLNYGVSVGTTGPVDLDSSAMTTADTLNPVADQDGVSVKYLWFCNVQVAEGINVYAELPEKEEPPVVDEEEDTTVSGTEDTVTEEEKTEEEKDDTPKTGAENFLGVAVATVVLGTVAVIALKRKNA